MLCKRKPRSSGGGPVGLTISHASALNILRTQRIAAGKQELSLPRIDLIPPSPGEGKRWSDLLLSNIKNATGLPQGSKLDVLVGNAKLRIRHSGFRNHVWSTTVQGLCFLEIVHDQIAIPVPEVLLAQMAESLPLPDLVALGHELCGKYTLRPAGSSGSAVYEITPATNTEGIYNLLKWASRLRGSKMLAAALPYIQDGALSPAETALSVMSQLPIDEFGYEIGRTILNEVQVPDASTRGIVLASERVPDILFANTNVGLNYDGDGHLNPDGVVAAARELEKADDAQARRIATAALRQAKDEMRKAAASDKQRDRDLLTMGLLVLPVTKYDLEDIAGLDLVMGQVIRLVEATTGRDMTRQKQAIRDDRLRNGRAEVLKRLFHA